MSEWVEIYVSWMAWILLAALPAMAWLTVRSWGLARKYWPFKIPVVIAIVNTIVGGCVTVLSAGSVFHLAIGIPPYWFPVLTSTAIVAQSLVVFLNSALLEWLDRQQNRPSHYHRRVGDNGYIH